MYYSSGNYEAFARPKKPEGVDNKSAYIVGSGLAALTAACYLVRDGQMKGEHVHVLEKGDLPGGACDGYKFENLGYVMRGGREMDNHFEVMWDLFRSIPSIETEGVSVLDEYYWLNKEDPNYSLCRATVNRGQDAHTDGKFDISDKGAMEIMKLFFTPNEQLQDKKITDFFDDEVLNSNFWLYWRTMFAFENWHSALEMKLYIQRYIHHIGGLPDFTALRFTKYNQYESMILPMVKYLESHNVQFHYGVQVANVEFDCSDPKHKLAKRIDVIRDGKKEAIDLTENDLVFITNGGCVENSSMGSQNEPAAYNTELKEGGGWDMWRKIAAQDPSFGHPDKFCHDPEQTNWMSATVETLDQKIIPYIKNICKRDPFTGHVVTGGIVTVKDSSWLMSWTINRQPQFRDAAQGPLPRLGLLPLHRQAGRLYQKAHARVHRQGDLHGVAVPHRRARGPDRRPRDEQRQHRARHDAVYRRVLHAARLRRPPERRARGQRQLRLPRPVCRDPARHDLHHRVFHAHRHGGRLYAAERRPRRARGLGQRV